MDEKLREAIGKAAYAILEVELPDIHPKSWDELTEEKKEINRRAAEAAVIVHNEWMYQHFKSRLGIKDEDERGDV